MRTRSQRQPVHAGTQTDLVSDPDKTLTEIEPAVLTSKIEVQTEARKKRKAID
jgi:hypothetical protein